MEIFYSIFEPKKQKGTRRHPGLGKLVLSNQPAEAVLTQPNWKWMSFHFFVFPMLIMLSVVLSEKELYKSAKFSKVSY